MKKYAFILCCLLTGTVALSAQQITRFAVVDTSRIYTTFLRDSRSVRDYQAKQAKYQAEPQRMSDEIIALRQKKVDAASVGKTMPCKNIKRKSTQKRVSCLSIPKHATTSWQC